MTPRRAGLYVVTPNLMSTTPETSPKPTENGAVQQRVINEDMHVTYANFVRGTLTPDEVILDFGFNSNAFGVKVLEEDIEIKDRIIFSPSAAKRMLFLLNDMIRRHEQNFGEVEVDFRRRLKGQEQPQGNVQA